MGKGARAAGFGEVCSISRCRICVDLAAVVLLVDSVARDLRLGLDSVPRDLLRLAHLEGDVLGGDDDSLAGAEDLGDLVEDEACAVAQGAALSVAIPLPECAAR